MFCARLRLQTDLKVLRRMWKINYHVSTPFIVSLNLANKVGSTYSKVLALVAFEAANMAFGNVT